MIIEYYRGKHILLTGATGFLGKVVLEKLFYTVRNFEKIYLLVRPKKGSKIMDRVKREIFLSPSFERVKSAIPNFE